VTYTKRNLRQFFQVCYKLNEGVYMVPKTNSRDMGNIKKERSKCNEGQPHKQHSFAATKGHYAKNMWKQERQMPPVLIVCMYALEKLICSIIWKLTKSNDENFSFYDTIIYG